MKSGSEGGGPPPPPPSPADAELLSKTLPPGVGIISCLRPQDRRRIGSATDLTRAEGGLPNNRGSRPAGLRAPMGRGGGAGCHSGIGADGRGRVERGTRGQGGAQDPPEQRGGDGHGGDDGGDVPAGGGMPRARVVAALHCGVAALMGRQVESGHGAE